MDFSIETTDGLTGRMTYKPTDDIHNNIFLSLNIIRGSWWFDPSFGMRDTRRMKNTTGNARLIEEYAKEALQWLLDTGRATVIEIVTQRDLTLDLNRLKLQITVTQADGNKVKYDKFVEVV